MWHNLPQSLGSWGQRNPILPSDWLCLHFSLWGTLELIEDSNVRDSYKRWYRVIGLVMWVFPLVVAVLEFLKLHPFGTRTVFFIEVAGIWTFAVYWLLKSREISLSKADVAAIEGDLVRPPRKPGVLQHWFDTTPHLAKKPSIGQKSAEY